MTSLDDRLLDAHARGDGAALVALYTQAADEAGSDDAACFYLTHAYIFGLEREDPAVPALHARLLAHGRV